MSENTTEKPPCAMCGEPARFTCPKCRVPQYNSRECQVGHWKAGHRAECAALPPSLQSVSIRPVPAGEDSSLALAASWTLATPSAGQGRDEMFHRFNVGPSVKTFVEGAAADRCLRVTPAEFVQLVALAANPRQGPVAIGVGDLAPWSSLAHLGCAAAQYAPALYGPADSDARAALKVATGEQGAWVLGPDRRGNYLGLSEAGPCRHPLAWWHSGLMRALDAAALPGLELVRGLGDLDFDQFSLRRAAE